MELGGVPEEVEGLWAPAMRLRTKMRDRAADLCRAANLFWMDGCGVLFAAEMVTRVQDRISASHTDPPREAKQNQTIYLARNIQCSGLNLGSILGR